MRLRAGRVVEFWPLGASMLRVPHVFGVSGVGRLRGSGFLRVTVCMAWGWSFGFGIR